MSEISFTLGQYHTPYMVKTAMSLPELVKESNAFSTKNRPGCVARLLSSQPKDLTLKYNVKCDLKTSNPAGHEVNIRFDASQVKDEASAKNLDVRVRCECEAFLYWAGQWNTSMRDALDGDPRPLYAPPTERLDLRGKFIICKHLAVVCDRILPSVQNNINTILRKREVERRKKEFPEKTPDKLLSKQEEMRKRQELKKVKDRRNREIQKKLLDGVRKREEGLIQRTEPATIEEKERVPTLAPKGVLETPKVLPPTPQAPPKTKSPPAPKKTEVIVRDEPAVIPDKNVQERLLDNEMAKVSPKGKTDTKVPRKNTGPVDRLLQKEQKKEGDQ
jgi:hypothetical protein